MRFNWVTETLLKVLEELKKVLQLVSPVYFSLSQINFLSYFYNAIKTRKMFTFTWSY